MRNSILAGVAAGAFLISAAGTALVLPHDADAADPTPTPAASATTPAATPATPAAPATPNVTTPGTDQQPGDADGDRGHGGPGGLDGGDLTAAAKALGMTEADLTTALQSGKTAATVATDKGVDVQKVIDAIVASDKAEIDAAVKAGTMTQAQADQRIASLTQHVTDEVNGTGFGGGRGGHHGGSDIDGDGQQPAASPTTGGTGTGA